jgi:UDP-N-acetylmuramyl-tripeptide synthetase
MEPTTLAWIAKQTGTDRVSGEPGTRITGLADDSRKVRPGDLFFGVSGAKADGAAFAADAVRRGARAVVVGEQVELPPLAAAVVRAADVRAALAAAIAACHGETIRRLSYVGVTGTNGKTTTTVLSAAVLRAAGVRTAVVGTLGTLREDGARIPCKNTTPGALDLVGQIEALSGEGYRALVMEVSSQAVVQHRASFLPFATAVWTNLSPEHFELHDDIGTYRKIKVGWIAECDRRARGEGRSGYASVVNLADPAVGEFLAPLRARVIGFGLEAVAPPDGFGGEVLLGSGASTGLGGGRMVVRHRDRAERVELALGGVYNLANALAAAAVGLNHGVEPAAIARGLASVSTVPGRFQRVPSEKRRVLVDYAHTSEGMENLLAGCRPLVPAGARLIVVFGCGGDRDNTKRPRMGRSAACHADLCIITNDNPRTEDPARITGQILEGIPAADRDRCLVEHDRRRAIELAVARAGSEDLVVIAGKGHEDYQLGGDRELHFDDYEVATEVLAAL